MPTGDPASNSRVILLIAHGQDAFPILKIAHESGFQRDSVWVGTSSWTAEMPADTSFLPSIPGYIGLIPYMSTGTIAQNYLIKLKAYELSKGLKVSSQISKFGAETADALVALATVMSKLPSADRNNGTGVPVFSETVYRVFCSDWLYTEMGVLTCRTIWTEQVPRSRRQWRICLSWELAGQLRCAVTYSSHGL